MQGIVYNSENFEIGSSQLNKDVNRMMDTSSQPDEYKKQQCNFNDSGFHSASGNSIFSEEAMVQSKTCDAENRSESSSPDRKYFCPICETVFTSQREFTLHIRSHNNELEPHECEKTFTCRICHKVLSSSSSLDRHSLIHSGERPFTCKFCGDTFTTNGNMHRHMRTHYQRNDSYESDSSNSSIDSKGFEFNNNKVMNQSVNISKDSFENNNNHNKRIFIEEEIVNPKKQAKGEPEDLTNRLQHQTFQCSVCERSDFTSLNALDMHLEDNHQDRITKCTKCKQTFKNNKLLTIHCKIAHPTENPEKNQSVIGFKDLTFVDFSSEKFPYIAKYECEKNLHTVCSGLKFICNSCGRAFPCSTSLNIHYKECTKGLDLSMNVNSVQEYDRNISDKNEVKRVEFFSRLDLCSKSVNKPNRSGSPEEPNVKDELQKRLLESNPVPKDLADIQSIISMTTCGSLLRHLQKKPTEILFHPMSKNTIDNCKQENEEESQDGFAAEFRKMKLRGEFPCRLCTAVFPNLRALKGHNRAHLNSNNNGTYRCNMCPHSSIDKAALIRHMRTHNGDRPYECSLCNYAFTTKANCERHLRNRHAKNTREDVKKAIIYHPSEDPSNNEITKTLSREDFKKVSNIRNNIELNNCISSPINSGSCERENFVLENKALNRTQLNHNLQVTANFLSLKNSFESQKLNCVSDNLTRNLQDLNKTEEKTSYLNTSIGFTPKVENSSTPQSNQKLQVKKLVDLKEFDNDKDNESNFVLDLSKKRNSENEHKLEIFEDLPQDLTKKSHLEIGQNIGNILSEQLLKDTPKIDPVYLSQLAFYRNSFNNLSNFPYWPLNCNPILFPSVQAPIFSHDSINIKEHFQRLQFCTGGALNNNFTDLKERFRHLHHTVSSSINPDNAESANFHYEKLSETNKDKPSNEIVDQQTNTEIENKCKDFLSNSPVPSISKPEMVHSSNSVKMVIKNGILMPKQKQRRYRTERPFSCEHCSARFTLRSNMERHIKQQHPQFWSQRQRSNVTILGRKNSSSKESLCNISVPSYQILKNSEHGDNVNHKISDKIKYAILAQHLKSNQDSCPRELDTKLKGDNDCALVIDENDHIQKTSKCDETEYTNSHNETINCSKNAKTIVEVDSKTSIKAEDIHDLVPVSLLLDNASQQQFKEYFHRENEEQEYMNSEDEEEGLVANSSTSEENNSGTDENRSEFEKTVKSQPPKKKSAYSLAPNRVSCPYCQRKFPWTSSLRRHILTHTGQKPFKCSHCPLLFTTKSNCDRHLLRKHGNSATTIINNSESTSNYLMRNVPERPFKCSSCPSSTFSTFSNLKKHISCKHSTFSSQSDDARSQVSTGYEAGSSEDEKQTSAVLQLDLEKQVSQNKISINNRNYEVQNNCIQNSELPFKCHLCDNSFSERQDTLDHIKKKHVSEYELLISKNVYENQLTAEENIHNCDDDNDVRGKFPDYTNRKVICAFCMRRFWSAEDLRRHMRTHTGERPFSCDICQRRFTLKHSMLRHRKKHNIPFENDSLHSDEEPNNVNPNTINHNAMAFDKLKGTEKTDESDGAETEDLISNLLGIRDRSIIDQVLTASADDAAKLLGVKSGLSE